MKRILPVALAMLAVVGSGLAVYYLWQTAPVEPLNNPPVAATATTTLSSVSADRKLPASLLESPGPKSCEPTGWGPSTASPIDEAPERESVGEGHVLRGVVRSSRDCSPIAGAKIIFWVANPDGEYDDQHRATVYTRAPGGNYVFESNFPGTYGGVRPHIHLYVSADGHRPIELEYLPQPGQTEGTFDIVLAAEP